MVDLSALNKRDKSNLSPRRVVSFCPARAFLGLFQEEKPRSRRKPSMSSSPWIRGAPRLGAPLSSGRLDPALPSKAFVYPPVVSPWRSSSSKFEIRHDASGPRFPGRPSAVTFPIRPETPGEDPELIENSQFGQPVSTLEYTELLTKCEVLHQQVLPRSKKPEDCSRPEEKEAEHREQ